MKASYLNNTDYIGRLTTVSHVLRRSRRAKSSPGGRPAPVRWDPMGCTPYGVLRTIRPGVVWHASNVHPSSAIQREDRRLLKLESSLDNGSIHGPPARSTNKARRRSQGHPLLFPSRIRNLIRQGLGAFAWGPRIAESDEHPRGQPTCEAGTVSLVYRRAPKDSPPHVGQTKPI